MTLDRIQVEDNKIMILLPKASNDNKVWQLIILCRFILAIKNHMTGTHVTQYLGKCLFKPTKKHSIFNDSVLTSNISNSSKNG